MSTIQSQETVGQLVARRPDLASAFEALGVDYCCGGKKTLEQACRDKGLDPRALCAKLEQLGPESVGAKFVDAAAMTLTELADHIERMHHDYLRNELPRLDMLSAKVAAKHGVTDPRLRELRKTLLDFTSDLMTHMMKEEQILFPIIRMLETSVERPPLHCGSVTNPIQRMELEHQDAGAALERMRILTDQYSPPEGACNTYRVLLDGLLRLERDMHQHVHKEDNILFPRAAELEEGLNARRRT